jgi:DNA-binding SARP family transcriptional activator/tetratricopeptide (TPR) repeat protein
MLDVHLLNERRISGGPDTEDRSLSSRSLDLLGYLVLHAGTPQTRQHLAFVFWPDSNEAQARTNLRRELHHLRSVLGEEPSLVVESNTLTWCDRPTCRVDVRVFEHEHQEASRAKAAGDVEAFLVHARTAIAEYHGDLMPGSYEDWVLEHRRPLLRKCVELCDDIVALLDKRGQQSSALDFAYRRVELQPLEEVGYRALMSLQFSGGDRAAAVSTFHRCADVLERELGVYPGRETTELVDRLLDRAGDAAHRRRGAAAETVNSIAWSGLVARGKELDVLVERWRVAIGGQPGMALVSGEPGVGKSRLLVELGTIAASEGAAVATTRCFSHSGRLAFAPVADWVRNPEFRQALEGLDPLWREEVARLVPNIVPGEPRQRQERSESPDVRPAVDAWQRHRFFEGLARAVLSPGRPIMLVLDDVHWCDQETMDWLVFLLGFAKDARLLVAGSARLDELERNREVVAALRGLRSAGLVADVELAPLDVTGTGELAAALLGRELGAGEEGLLQAATGGYPLFVLEAARSLTDAATSRAPLRASDLDAILRRRLERASPTAQEAASIAAAVGRNFSLDLLSEAAGFDADVLVQAVDELWRLRIVRESTSGGYDFSHDLMRDAAYGAVSPARRWLLHRKVAEALEVIHADHLDTVAAALAEQYDRGGRPDRALVYLQKAAEAATSLFANAEAVRLYRRCLELIEAEPKGRDRDARELEILQSMSAPSNALYGYASPVTQTTLEKTVQLAERLGRTPILVRSLVALFGTRFVQGSAEQSYEVAHRALALAGNDAELAAQAHFAFAGSVFSLGHPATAAEHFELAIKISPAAVSLLVGTRLDVHSQGWSAHAHWLLGEEDEAAARADDALNRARAADHPYSVAVALAYAAITAQLCGDPDALAAAIAELDGLCRRYEFAYYGEWALILEGWAAGGEVGVTQVRDGISRLRALGSLARMPYWLWLLSSTLDAVGRREEAAAVLDGAIVDAQQRHERWWLPEVLRCRAAFEEGPAADTLIRRACELAREHGSQALESRCLTDLLAIERSGPPESANP